MRSRYAESVWFVFDLGVCALPREDGERGAAAVHLAGGGWRRAATAFRDRQGPPCAARVGDRPAELVKAALAMSTKRVLLSVAN